MNSTIIIPAYNESHRIVPFLKKVIQFSKKKLKNYEILIVNDGSTDDTKDVVQKLLRKQKNIKLIGYTKNKGKGGAVQYGVAKAKGEKILFIDADGSTQPDQIPKMLEKLEEYDGNLQRSSIELVKEWRTDKSLQQLEAMLVVTDKEKIFVISGVGDVVEPDDQIATIGSGGPYALAAARALISASPKLSAEAIATKALEIAADICVFTNKNIKVESLK